MKVVRYMKDKVTQKKNIKQGLQVIELSDTDLKINISSMLSILDKNSVFKYI